jgi:hypothetical protein
MNLISLRYKLLINIIPRFFSPVLGEQFQMKKSGEITSEVDRERLPRRGGRRDERRRHVTARHGG